MLFLPGDDGAHFGEQAALKDRHPGFGALMMSYSEIEDSWSTVSSSAMAFPVGAPVTTPAARWGALWVIPSGEVRPGVRTPRVVALVLPGGEARGEEAAT